MKTNKFKNHSTRAQTVKTQTPHISLEYKYYANKINTKKFCFSTTGSKIIKRGVSSKLKENQKDKKMKKTCISKLYLGIGIYNSLIRFWIMMACLVFIRDRDFFLCELTSSCAQRYLHNDGFRGLLRTVFHLVGGRRFWLNPSKRNRPSPEQSKVSNGNKWHNHHHQSNECECKIRHIPTKLILLLDPR